MADIMSGFSGFSNLAGMGWAVVWFMVGLFGMLILTFIVVMIVGKLRGIPIMEIDMVTRKIRKLSGRYRKYTSGQSMLYVGKIKKWLPQIQQEDKLLIGKKEFILLIKDNNGLHHATRVPTMTEIMKWHEVMYNKPWSEVIAEPNPGSDVLNVINTVYTLPNPREDMEWLASQAIQANKEFATEWWKNPMVAIIGTVFICAMTFIVTIIIAKLM